MSTIVTRAGKGSELTHAEVDANFTNLNTDKYQSGANASFTTVVGTSDVASGSTASLLNGSSPRWIISRATSESSSNLGSNFSIAAYDDSGTLIGTYFRIHRSNGNVLINSTTDDGVSKLQVTGDATVTGSVAFSSNITSSGTAKRFIADFSNATPGNRFSFQTSTANSATVVSVIPTGTSQQSIFRVVNSPGYVNGATGSFGISSASTYFNTGFIGSGTALPMDFAVNDVAKARLTTAGRLIVGGTTDDATNVLQVLGGCSLTTGNVYKINNVQVVAGRDTGWTAGTGTQNKGAFAAYAGATHTASYVQATIQALDDATKAASQRLLAIDAVLRTHGLIGT